MRRMLIISDLHLGGRPDEYDDSGKLIRPGFQICYSYRELVSFIDWITSQDKENESEEFELVMNGDVVDFLADDDFGEKSSGAQVWTISDDEAVRKLNRIAELTRMGGNRGVFEALRDFLAADNRLTMLLGNHDVELSLPAVRQHLVQLLGGETAHLRFIYDGEAYTVGRVLIEHGNRYDRWNQVNHSALRQERSVRSRRLPIENSERARFFIPPAGTYLVINFMNRIKSRYRFIDLLKPETNAAIPLLLALEPN